MNKFNLYRLQTSFIGMFQGDFKIMYLNTFLELSSWIIGFVKSLVSNDPAFIALSFLTSLPLIICSAAWLDSLRFTRNALKQPLVCLMSSWVRIYNYNNHPTSMYEDCKSLIIVNHSWLRSPFGLTPPLTVNNS